MKYDDITVILLLYKTPKKILKNLKDYRKFKILVLDQSNDHNIKHEVKNILPNILYYKVTDKNEGFAKGINFLSKKVKTKYFLCTQPDVKINLQSIKNLKKVFRDKKDCIISIPKIKSYKNYNIKKNNKKIIPVDNMIGAIFLTKIKLFNRINKFDEDFFFYWEDLDLSRRVRNSKFQIYLNKDSYCEHLGGKSTSSTLKNMFIKEVNFKFGEYLYQYKYSELRFIKVLREPLTNFLIGLIYLIIFQLRKSLKKFFSILGIIKFLGFIILKQLK